MHTKACLKRRRLRQLHVSSRYSVNLLFVASAASLVNNASCHASQPLSRSEAIVVIEILPKTVVSLPSCGQAYVVHLRQLYSLLLVAERQVHTPLSSRQLLLSLTLQHHFQQRRSPSFQLSRLRTRPERFCTISRPSSVTYRRSPSWSAAFSDGVRTPTSACEQAECLASRQSTTRSPARNSRHHNVGEKLSSTTSLPARKHYLHTRTTRGFEPEEARRWSLDAIHLVDSKRSCNAVRDDRLSWDLSKRPPQAAQCGYPQPTRPCHDIALSRSQSADTFLRGRLTPLSASRCSPSRDTALRINSPCCVDTTDRGFANTFVKSPTEKSSTLPGSPLPLPRSRPGSAGAPRDLILRSPLAQTNIHTWSAALQGQIQDEDATYQPHTPVTVRPTSGTLQPIIEDLDAPLADTSVFFYDTLRFSSTSTRSEPAATRPPSSPISGAPTDSLTSSRCADKSTQGSPSGFQPKHFIITRSASLSDGPRSRRLSRSNSVPLLRLDLAHSNQCIDEKAGERSRHVTATSPSCPYGTLLTPTAPARQKPMCARHTSNGSEWPLSEPTGNGLPQLGLEGAEEGTEVIGLRSESIVTNHSSCAKDFASKHDVLSSGTCIFGSSVEAACPNDDFDLSGTISRRMSTPTLASAARLPTLILSSANAPALATPSKPNNAAAFDDPDQTLHSDSLSPPRSAASADSRSSGPIELVPWQVATTGPDGMRKSEEIFRPLSLTMSPRAISKDTATFASLLGRSSSKDDVDSCGSALLKMPATPLKGSASWAEWRSCPDGEIANVSGSLVPATEPQIGLGFSIPRPNDGEDQGYTPYRQPHSSTEGMRVSVYSPLEKDAGIPACLDDGVQSPSIRRHLQKPAHDGVEQQRCSAMDPDSATRLDIVVESPGRSVAAVMLPSQTLASNEEDACLGGGADAGVAGRNMSPSIVHGGKRKALPFCALITVAAIVSVYQILFFTFEAAYLWIVVSPALPIIAAALFLLLDVLLVRLFRMRKSKTRPVLRLLPLTILTSFTLAYCAGMSILMIANLVHCPDQASSAPGIHFNSTRHSTGGQGALQQVLGDMPMSAVLAIVGVLGGSTGLILTATLGLKSWFQRRKA